MRNEVFAEDIEALLERLDGVAAARVVATDAGVIDRIYVTAEGDREVGAVRQLVAAALMSRYSLAVDGWRIRVARLRPERAARPRWSAQRVEEVFTATELRVTVELRAEDGGGPLVGRARGLSDPAGRLRIPALATLDALAETLAAEDRRVMVESIVPVPLSTGRAMVVALSLAGPSAAEAHVGSAVVEGSEAEAVIAATLDAVGKRAMPERRRWVMRDRREELEAMDAHYRRLREPQRQMPQPAPPAEETSAAAAPDDEEQVEQIRPERQGGAEVAQPISRPPEVDRGRAVPKSSMEDEFFRHLMVTGTPVHIRCRDGYEIHGGVVRNFGTYSVLVESGGVRELIFKHGIIAVRPMKATD